jgi:hypothetical protein
MPQFRYENRPGPWKESMNRGGLIGFRITSASMDSVGFLYVVAAVVVVVVVGLRDVVVDVEVDLKYLRAW